MKKIIFRFPTTKKSRIIGASLLESAMILMETAEHCKVDGEYTEEGVLLVQKSCDLWNKAAKRFGFRNLADMEEYKQRYGLKRLAKV